jgi:hypothetical protein
MMLTRVDVRPSASLALRDLQHEFQMHDTLRAERFYVREALAMLGPMMIMKHGGTQTLDTFMQERSARKQLQRNLRRAAFEVFSCVHALHKHGIVHRVRRWHMRTITCSCLSSMHG